jgi:chromate transport protein ChrA
MYGLSLGVARIGETLPGPVYALLSGLNAATVGIIALAAVQLSDKAITDKLTRALVFLTGASGMLYTALWYFPVLMAGAGVATLVWDFKWLQIAFSRISRKIRRRKSQAQEPEDTAAPRNLSATSREIVDGLESTLHHRTIPTVEPRDVELADREPISISVVDSANVTRDLDSVRVVPSGIELKVIGWKTGAYVLAGFFISFIVVMITRSVIKSRPRGVSLFGNLYLAGTIIFGGGPVVIPLLREYIVAEGWVSPRDFLLGLALIQSFPGPNFNFAVYLGSLATVRTPLPSFAGAIIGFLGIFAPGIIIVIAVMGLWKVLRSRRWFLSILRGVNAGAVGLVFTAVYKLWQIGFVDADYQSGSPLGRDPWWVAITATSFVGGAWFGLSAPFAILLGGVMGLIWYGVVKA